MVTGLTLNLFDFQEQAVMQLLDLTTDSRSMLSLLILSSMTPERKPRMEKLRAFAGSPKMPMPAWRFPPPGSLFFQASEPEGKGSPVHGKILPRNVGGAVSDQESRHFSQVLCVPEGVDRHAV